MRGTRGSLNSELKRHAEPQARRSILNSGRTGGAWFHHRGEGKGAGQCEHREGELATRVCGPVSHDGRARILISPTTRLTL
jgi:hypothetical protein